MIWNFKEDIATYEDTSFIMVVKVKLVEFDKEDGQGYDTDLVEVYKKGNIDPQLFTRIMTRLGEGISQYGFDKFNIYRHCEVCNKLFLKKSKNKWICSNKCKTKKYRN